MGENRRCDVERKSDEGKGRWRKLSAHATEARIGGASKLIPSIPATGVKILGGLHDNASAPATSFPFDHSSYTSRGFSILRLATPPHEQDPLARWRRREPCCCPRKKL